MGGGEGTGARTVRGGLCHRGRGGGEGRGVNGISSI